MIRTALENVPVAARGICSGILQQGYSFGYLLAAVINLGVVPKVASSWRALYFIGAGFSVLAAIVRACLPESQQFILARQEAKANNLSSGAQSKAFGREIWTMLKTNWLRCIWAICIMTGEPFRQRSTRASLTGRFQLLFTWKSGFVPRLSRDYQGVLEFRCLESYHHQ